MVMNAKNPQFLKDRTERQRRKNLSDDQVKELELAGGVEGGMQAGSAGGPKASDTERASTATSGKAITSGRSQGRPSR